MTVGTIVTLKQPMLGNDRGVLGVCYERYNIGHEGFSFIFENGSYDGFSAEEAARFLEEVGFCDGVADYQFTNVMRVAQDFQGGRFDIVFKRAEK